MVIISVVLDTIESYWTPLTHCMIKKFSVPQMKEVIQVWKDTRVSNDTVHLGVNNLFKL